MKRPKLPFPPVGILSSETVTATDSAAAPVIAVCVIVTDVVSPATTVAVVADAVKTSD